MERRPPGPSIAVRNLRRDAGFTTFAILIVGLGIGASATVYSVVVRCCFVPCHSTIPLGLSGSPTPAAARPHMAGRPSGRSPRSEQDHGRPGRLFAYYGVGDVKLTGVGEPERLTGVKVTENFFPLLGVQPVVGRNFTPEECRRKWDDIPAVLLSYGLWKRRFASDPAIVGRKLVMKNRPLP